MATERARKPNDELTREVTGGAAGYARGAARTQRAPCRELGHQAESQSSADSVRALGTEPHSLVTNQPPSFSLAVHALRL